MEQTPKFRDLRLGCLVLALVVAGAAGRTCPGPFAEPEFDRESDKGNWAGVGLAPDPAPFLWGVQADATDVSIGGPEQVFLVIGSETGNPNQFQKERLAQGRVVELPFERVRLYGSDNLLGPHSDAQVTVLDNAVNNAAGGTNSFDKTEEYMFAGGNDWERVLPPAKMLWKLTADAMFAQGQFSPDQSPGEDGEEWWAAKLDRLVHVNGDECVLDASGNDQVSVSGDACSPGWTVAAPTNGQVLPGLGTVTADGQVLAAWLGSTAVHVSSYVVVQVEVDGDEAVIAKVRATDGTDSAWFWVNGALPRDVGSSDEVIVPRLVDSHLFRSTGASGTAFGQGDGFLMRLPAAGNGDCFEVLVFYFTEDHLDPVSPPVAEPGHSLGEVLHGDGWVFSEALGVGYYLFPPDAGLTAGFVSWKSRNDTGYLPVVGQVAWDLKDLGVPNPEQPASAALYWATTGLTVAGFGLFFHAYTLPTFEMLEAEAEAEAATGAEEGNTALVASEASGNAEGAASGQAGDKSKDGKSKFSVSWPFSRAKKKDPAPAELPE